MICSIFNFFFNKYTVEVICLQVLCTGLPFCPAGSLSLKQTGSITGKKKKKPEKTFQSLEPPLFQLNSLTPCGSVSSRALRPQALPFQTRSQLPLCFAALTLAKPVRLKHAVVRPPPPFFFNLHFVFSSSSPTEE